MYQNNENTKSDFDSQNSETGGSMRFEDDGLPRRYYDDSVGSKVVQLVIKYLNVDEKQANYILLGIIVMIVITSLFLFFGGSEPVGEIISDPGVSSF